MTRTPSGLAAWRETDSLTEDDWDPEGPAWCAGRVPRGPDQGGRGPRGFLGNRTPKPSSKRCSMSLEKWGKCPQRVERPRRALEKMAGGCDKLEVVEIVWHGGHSREYLQEAWKVVGARPGEARAAILWSRN